MEPLLLQRLAPAVVEEYRKHAYGSRIDLHLDEKAPPAHGDANYFEQVMFNLLSNADKYSPSDCPIEIDVDCSEDYVRLSIADRGAGIPDDELDLVFRPFYRSSKTQSSEGFGIGLTVCQRLIDAQAGRIWAEHREGGGTIFRVQLPVSTAGYTHDP